MTPVDPSYYIETYKASDGWRWRLKARNHEVIAHGEAYLTKWNLRRFLSKWSSETVVYWIT